MYILTYSLYAKLPSPRYALRCLLYMALKIEVHIQDVYSLLLLIAGKAESLFGTSFSRIIVLT